MQAEQLHCLRCKEVFDEECAKSRRTFIGNREEPAEYELRCPRCGSPEVDVTYRVVCDCCEIKPVKHDGSLCEECRTVGAEIAADAARGH